MSRKFSTLNIYLAAYLGMMGLKHTIVKGYDGKLLFAFDDTVVLRDTLTEFNNGGSVPAWQYIEFIKRFKTDLYNAKR